MARLRLAPAIVALVVLMSTACSSDAPKYPTAVTGSPSAASTPSGTASARPGRLAVYAAVARFEQTPTGRFATAEVVAWDLDANRLSSKFEFGAQEDAPVGAALANGSLVFATRRAVTRADLAGTNRQPVATIPEGSVVQDIAVSPDARFLAIVLASGNAAATGEVRVIELASGREMLAAKQSDSRFQGLRGQFWQAQWRGDNSGVLLHTATNSEMYGSLATVFLDGRVRIEQADGYGNVSPTGSLRAGAVGQIPCMVVGSHEFAIRELDEGGTPVHAAADNIVYTPWEWSPDGREFVWLQQNARDCSELSPARQEIWLVKTSDGKSFGAPERVTDLQALHRRWYGDNLFTLDCAPSSEPIVNRWGDMRIFCGGDPVDASHPVLVGGRPAGEGMNVQPLGVIER